MGLRWAWNVAQTEDTKITHKILACKVSWNAAFFKYMGEIGG
jgi:hypothetical protein